MPSRFARYHLLRWSESRRAVIVLAAIIAVIAVAITLGAMRWVDATARTEARRAAEARTLAATGLIASELQKYRLLPLVLADYPDVTAALADRSPAAIDRLNRTLELLADRTDAAAIYLIGRDGVTIAASNARRPESFVGQNYGFRPYFTRALAQGAAEQFALGTVSHRPGLFLARSSARRDGVVVVKVEFDRIEGGWARQPVDTLVRDANGVIAMANRPAWRLHATRALDPKLAAQLRTTLQYGDRTPPSLPLPRGNAILTDRQSGDRFLMRTADVPVPGWTLSVIEPMAPALRSAAAQARFAALATALLVLIAAGLAFRAREKRLLAATARRALEDEVRKRTAELREANAQLVLEHEQRERDAARLRAAREELAQANRLGTLGQITAGVAHEVNQPVTAIRTFAENAMIMSDRSDTAGVRGNLARIVDLTQRIGQITSELRLFARREHVRGPVPIDDAIDGALLLMGDRLRSIAIVRNGDRATILVVGDRVRLEQVIINLLQNAADALTGRADPAITFTTTAGGGDVTLVIADNGPGVPPDKRGHLFTPFVTGKADGLGLGLAIARDIVREFDGELSYKASAAGATFAIRLRKA